MAVFSFYILARAFDGLAVLTHTLIDDRRNGEVSQNGKQRERERKRFRESYWTPYGFPFDAAAAVTSV